LHAYTPLTININRTTHQKKPLQIANVRFSEARKKDIPTYPERQNTSIPNTGASKKD